MFDNATKLTPDILMNDFSFKTPWEQKQEVNKLLEYYFNTCAVVRELYYLHPTREQIEEYITNGNYIYIDSLGNETDVICPITDVSERKYIFLAAQAKQLIYDIGGGRGAMLRGEDKKYNLCEDAIDKIKELGLYQRTFMQR
jgi:peptidase E